MNHDICEIKTFKINNPIWEQKTFYFLFLEAERHLSSFLLGRARAREVSGLWSVQNKTL